MLSKKPRNVERRQRYANDPDYRDQVMRSTRDRYRRKHGLVARGGVNHFDLRRIGRYCERHDVWVGSQFLESRLVMTIKNLALIIGRKPDVVRRWIDQYMLPPPVGMIRHDRKGHGQVPVYFLEEVREIVHTMRDHQAETPYFRQDHTDTIDCLRSVLNGIRESL